MAETVTACAIISCGTVEDKPPPVGKDLDVLYESLGISVKDTEHAPYRDATIARIHRKVTELENETVDKDRKIKELSEEIDNLKKEASKSDGRYDNTADDDSRNSSDSGSVEMDAKGVGKTFEATFYTAFCPSGCTGVTATGVDVSNTIYHEGKRIIAVDPNVIPLGSHVKVTLEDGTSFEATAQDTGGDIEGNRIDVLVSSRDEAYKLGRQSVKVEIIK